MANGAAGRLGPRGRMGVVRLGRLIAGPAFTTPNHMFRLAREQDLGYFQARRVEETISKHQVATAMAFVLGDRHPMLDVGGALLQRGQGHSSSRTEGGKRYLRGNEAAHFGIGTIAQQGEAYSVRSSRLMLERARRAGVGGGEFAGAVRAGGQLATQALVYDARTYYAPAIVNRSEGLLEVPKQILLIGALPIIIPSTTTALENAIRTTGFQVLDLMTGTHALAPIQARLRALAGGGKEFLQDPLDPDSGNRLFNLRERDFLDATYSAFRDGSSSFDEEIRRVASRIPERAADLAALSAEAADELASLST